MSSMSHNLPASSTSPTAASGTNSDITAQKNSPESSYASIKKRLKAIVEPETAFERQQISRQRIFQSAAPHAHPQLMGSVMQSLNQFQKEADQIRRSGQSHSNLLQNIDEPHVNSDTPIAPTLSTDTSSVKFHRKRSGVDPNLASSPLQAPVKTPIPSLAPKTNQSFRQVFDSPSNYLGYTQRDAIQAHIERLFCQLSPAITQRIAEMSKAELLGWTLSDRDRLAQVGEPMTRGRATSTTPSATTIPGCELSASRKPESLSIQANKEIISPKNPSTIVNPSMVPPKESLSYGNTLKPQPISQPIYETQLHKSGHEVLIDTVLSYDGKVELHTKQQGRNAMVDLSNYKDLTKPPVNLEDELSMGYRRADNVVSMEPHQAAAYNPSYMPSGGFEPPPGAEAYLPDIEPMYSENVRTLIKLVQDLPDGVSKATGAQIIRLTMEAMGISMENVLSEAQHVQSEMLDGVRGNIKKIEEYKTIIWKLESEIRAQQSKANDLSEIIDLFVSHHGSSMMKKPEMSMPSPDGFSS